MKAWTGVVLLALALTGRAGGTFGPGVRIAGVSAEAMAVDAEGDRLYVAAGTRLSVLDISSPLEPTVLGELEGVDNRRQLVVRNGFVYLVSRETGLRIVDCTDPRRPRLRSRFDTVEFATGIEVVGRTAFVSERINGVEVVDVSDPDRPAHVAIRKTGESQSSRYLDGYLYSGEWGVGEVTVFDARDLGSFREVARLQLHGFGDGLEAADGFLYCSTGHDARHSRLKGADAAGRGRGLEIFSLKDPARPQPVGRVDFPRFIPRNDDYWTVRTSRGMAFCADSHNGLFAVDVRMPSAPKVVDRFCVPDAKHPDWPSLAVSSLTVGRGCLYVTVKGAGLFVVPVVGLEPEPRRKGAEPLSVGWREPYSTDEGEFCVFRPERSGQARTALVRKDVVYAAFGDAGLHVLQVGADGGFTRLGELPARKVYDCAFVGERLLTAEGTDGFALYELDGPTGFREVARRLRLSSGATVACWCWGLPDGRAVLTGRTGGLRFVGVEAFAQGPDLGNFSFSCQWDKYLADSPLQGSLPVIRPGRGIVWLDLTGAKPVEVTRPKCGIVPRQTNGVCVFDDNTFLVTGGREYAFVGRDGVQRGGQREFPGLDAGMSGGGLPRSDGRLVVLTARSARKAALYDFSDREHPKLLRNWTLAGNPDAAAFCGNRVLIPAGHQGLLMTRRAASADCATFCYNIRQPSQGE